MLKRVALFVIWLMVAIGALLLFEYFSGASMSGTRNAPPPTANVAPQDDQPYAYEGRRPENAARMACANPLAQKATVTSASRRPEARSTARVPWSSTNS